MSQTTDDFEFLQETEEEERGPALDLYGTDLTLLARLGQLEQCFGRERELLELMEILVRRQKNNPVLVGDAGVGKTAIVELFATKIVTNLVPFVLEGRSIVSIDLARIVAGSRYRGEFELRFQRVLDEVLAQPNIIIFIDEIHNIGGTGSAEGSLDAANILKPVLSRSGFQCIGSTTVKEYQRIEKDPALNRRFQPVKVKEPSIQETVHILYGLRPSLESFHNVEILPGTLKLAADLASRYIYERFLPDKAIDLLDRAAAKEVIRITSVTEGSVISSVVNASLNTIGTLKLEAFRRGDIGTEFIFQEIENAYRNFLLRWVESPSKIEESLKLKEKLIENKKFSPLSEALYDEMKLSILKRVDELLFSSPKPRFVNKIVRKVENLSIQKNIEIYGTLADSILNQIIPDQSIYRVSLFLFVEWLESENLNFLTPSFRENYFSNLIDILHETKMYDYLCSVRQDLNEDFLSYFSQKDFCETDVESYEGTFELLSELEEKRIDIVKDFLLELKPLLRKGIIESLKYSSEIILTADELKTVYNLVGYFSTETGKDFLANLDDPDLIRRARKLGDFTGLKKRITQREIRELLSDITGIPIQSISTLESQKLLNLERTLHKRVIGQDEAIAAISKAIRRSRLGIQNPNRPIASFLFCGPTGVGKTEVTKALAVSMFGSESDMIRFDMSEFMEKFTVSRLIGSPPGYVGYDEGGQLTDSVRKKPYSVVLFDEVEKAHPDILNVLLQILEDGRLTDSQKRLVPFENTVIIMTSNAGAEEIQQIIRDNGNQQKSEETNSQQKSFTTQRNEEIENETEEIFEDFENKDNEKNGLPGYVQKKLDDETLNKIESEIQKKIDEEIEEEFKKIAKDLEEKLKAELTQQIEEQFDNQISEELEKELNEELQKQIKEELESENNKDLRDEIEQKIRNKKRNELVVKYNDFYAGPIEFLRSPITENFLVDINGELGITFEDSYRNLQEYETSEVQKKDIPGVKMTADAQIIKTLKRAVLERLTTIFLPEFLNRLDDIIIFQPLKPEELRKICDIMVKDVVERVKPKKILLSVDQPVKEKLTREGYNPIFGARPLRRLITKYVEDLISENILRNPIRTKTRTIRIILDENEQIIVKKNIKEE